MMIRNYEWVDYIFVQSTAWYLNHDIIITTTTSTEEHPYITISGNLNSANIGCQGIELTIGSKSGVYYQSLLPLEITVSKNKMSPFSPEDTIELKLAVSAIPRGNENKSGVDLDSKKEFPELMASKAKSQVQSRTSSPKKRSAKD